MASQNPTPNSDSVSAPSPSTLESIILARHSTRAFLPTPIPPSIIHTSLQLAQHSPSNSNIQPWRLILLSGPARDRLSTALQFAASSTTKPKIPPLPEAFAHFRSDLGHQIYGVGLGISRDDAEGRLAASRRNFSFFGAPTVGIVCMDRRLGVADALSVGMWLQSLVLALTERGVGSCVQVSLAGYPEVVREVIGEDVLGTEMDILCGVSMGYEDGEMGVNRLNVGREEVERNVVFLED